jgi:acyl-ACP thioesterase
VALWVHLDPETRAPAPFSEDEIRLYGDQAAARRIRARLRHPAPPAGIAGVPWRFRAVDLDVADHVNNAAYWEPAEEEILAGGIEPGGLDAEMEFRSGAQPGDTLVLADGGMRWITDAAGEEVYASLALVPIATHR